LNPYLARFYDALAEQGIARGPDAKLSLQWLLENRSHVRWLHAHWPESLYRWHRGPRPLRQPLSWVKLVMFQLRLLLARGLGYRIAWTVHQLYPHDSTQPALDRAGSKVLAAAADLLIAHDRLTAELAQRELGQRAEPIVVVRHGSYVGAYPPGRPPDVVRAELGITSNEVMLLCFGEVRSDSDVELLLDAFMASEAPSLRLLLAGNVKAAAAAAAIEEALRRDQRIFQRRGFVPFERVAELYDAADAAVMPRGNGGTSGSLILALSLGVPVIAADTPTYREITGDGAAAWLFEPASMTSLMRAIDDAARSSEIRSQKAIAAAAATEALDWAASAHALSVALGSSR
jgi:beta-1,4-mannosyltransferase